MIARALHIKLKLRKFKSACILKTFFFVIRFVLFWYFLYNNYNAE